MDWSLYDISVDQFSLVALRNIADVYLASSQGAAELLFMQPFHKGEV